MTNNRPLLTLDLDETLIQFSSGRPLDLAPDFMVGPYHVFQRPNFADFLAGCAELYTLAVRSSAGSEYVDGIVNNIFQNQPQFPVSCLEQKPLHNSHALELRDEVHLKDLTKVKRLGFDLRRVLIVEDEPNEVARHYGNAIFVQPFVGAADDAELLYLGRYLTKLHDTPNFRQVEKRSWKRSVLGKVDGQMEQ